MRNTQASKDVLSPVRHKVVMLVWNAFTNDARVMREAESLIDSGKDVSVIAVLTPEREVEHEVLQSGLEVRRVSRKVGILLRMVMLPRRGLRWLSTRLGVKSQTTVSAPRWWALDRRLVLFFAELHVNYRMYRQAKALHPDVVHAHDVNTLSPAWLAARLSNARLIYDAHEISADREGYHGRVWLVRLVEKFLGKSADGHITTTQMRAKWFEENYGYAEMTVLQNRPMKRIVRSSERIRQRLNIAADRTIILYQGGLQWGRGLRNLIEAVRGLPQADLVFLGDGLQRESLEREAADMAGRVHFIGKVPLDELPEWTASADIGVQTLRNVCLNHYTTDSNKLFEYVMAGLPVVASDFPEIRAIVEKHDLGLLVDPKSPEQVRAALRRLIDDEGMRYRLATNARHARDQLDWSTQAPKLIALYDRVLRLE